MDNQSSARWYVYMLTDPRTESVFYVGKGSGKRIHHHEREAASEKAAPSKKVAKIRAILSAGCEVGKQINAMFWDEQAAYDHETDLIEEIGLANLTNVLPGGQKAWERRRQERSARRKKSKPVPEMHEQLARGADELIARFAEWFKAGGHSGRKFAFTATDPAFRFHAKISAYTYNEFLPMMWKHIRQDKRALPVFTEKIRPFGVEVQYGGQ